MDVKSALANAVRSGRPGILLRYSLLAFLTVALLTAGLLLLRETLTTPIVALLFLLPVLISATRWGLGAGIMASVTAFLAFNYFFIEPYYTLRVHQSQDIIALIVFLIVAVAGSQLVGRLQAETRARVLEESDRLKSALLASVSHELRTPLVTIKAAVTGLRSKEIRWSASARDELLAALEEEADRMNLLIANLLNMSRLEAGPIELQRRWNALAEIVDSAIEQITKSASGDHHLKVDVPDDLPPVPVDAVLMQQVFANLISNGLKYAPVGTTIRIEAHSQDAKSLLVQVTNEGPHVPEEHLEHIFDKFHRITRAGRAGGIGLGLSICKSIVELHGGRIWAENLPGGFAFKLTLPLDWQGGPRPHMPGDSEQA